MLPTNSLQIIVCRVSSMAWETKVQSQVELYQRLKKWYLLNIQHYKVRIKGKVE